MCRPTTSPCSRMTSGSKCTSSRRSEEHTSELQSRLHLVCRLLLEKQKINRRQETAPVRRPILPVPSPRAHHYSYPWPGLSSACHPSAPLGIRLPSRNIV